MRRERSLEKSLKHKENDKESIITDSTQLVQGGFLSDRNSYNNFSIIDLAQTKRTVPRYGNLNLRHSSKTVPKILDFRQGKATFMSIPNNPNKPKTISKILSGNKTVRIPSKKK